MRVLHSLVEGGCREGLYLGSAWRVFDADRTLAEGVTGLAQESPALPVTLRTLWDLASLTKGIVTATGVLLLAESGHFHLDEEVGQHLPGCAPGLAGVTLRHCLTHTSGLRAWERLPALPNREDVLAHVRGAERCRPPGAGYTYSDLGYILLGQLIEHTTGLGLDGFARERIFAPLQMPDAGFRPGADLLPRIAATRGRDTPRVLVGDVHDDNCAVLGGVAGHAGLFGSLEDLTRFGQAHLAASTKPRRLLSGLSHAAMATNQNRSGLSGHTIGWFICPNGFLPAGDLLPPDTFGHTGFTGTSLLLIPSLRLGVALLTNRVYQTREAAGFLRFRRRFHNAVAAAVS